MAVAFVPIRTNAPTRQSRLMQNIPSFLALSTIAIVRFYTMYRPLQVFLAMGGLFIAGSVALGLRFLFYYIQGLGTGRVQSLILAAILAIVGFQVCLVGLIADLVRLNRKMLEETLFRVRRAEIDEQ
jgi:hypothetical protein